MVKLSKPVNLTKRDNPNIDVAIRSGMLDVTAIERFLERLEAS